MHQPQRHRRRLVSKSRYIQTQGLRVGIGSIGAGMLGLAVLFGGWALMVLICILLFFRHIYQIGEALYVLVGISLLSGASFLLGRKGKSLINRAVELEPGIPLTRETVNALPPEESLVRGSEAPQTTSETLLRPAQARSGEPPQQLLRAATSEDETP